jgi:DNA-binding response OmpR family regulator
VHSILTLAGALGRAVKNSQLGGRVLLVVEDEPLISLDVAGMLTASGAHVVSASRIVDAIAAVERIRIFAAVLDINLGQEDCSPVCRYLSERGIPFLFYTGYASTLKDWSGVPVVAKPATPQQVVDAVERLCNPRLEAAE